MTLKFMERSPLNPGLMTCPHCSETDQIGVHSHQERRYRCHACGRTFAETQGTPLFRLKYPIWVVVLILTLLAHGCPLQAIVVAFFIDERTIADWLAKAGKHGEHIQDQVVCNGQVELGQVQPDELFVKMQGGKVLEASLKSTLNSLSQA